MKNLFVGCLFSMLAAVPLCVWGTEDLFVRVSQKNPGYFELSDGSAYIPIGYNLCFPQYSSGLSDDECFKNIESHMKNMAENGGNYARIWVSSPFYEIEDEKAGVYNPVKLARIDRVVELAKKYGIRLKICLEHFRNLKGGGAVSPFFSRPAYDSEFKNMDEFFSSQKGRDLYFNRFKALFDRYGNDSAVFAWELWNEQNTVKADPKTVKSWQEYMFARIAGVCKKQLIVNSFGSFDSDWSKKSYKLFYSGTANAIAAIHRYLDEGAEYSICQAPADLSASDAVLQMSTILSDRPILLAETGAVQPRHSGKWRYYDADKSGAIFHDFFYTPFFCGAAGPGEMWHWDEYIFKHKHWRHMKPFAKIIEGIDIPRQDFKPFRADSKGLRVYALEGKKSILAFVRDSCNDWKSEFEMGKYPRDISSASVDFSNYGKGREIAGVRIFNLWNGEVLDAEKSLNVKLPVFSRSCAVRIDFK